MSKPALTLCSFLAFSGAAQAQAVLPPQAFVATPACPLDPYAEPGLGLRESRLKRSCGSRAFELRSDSPSTRRSRVAVDHHTAYQLDNLSFNYTLGWAGWRDSVRPVGRTERATVAGATLLRLSDDWALDANIGRDLRAGQRLRRTLSSIWKPRDAHVTFLQWETAPAGLSTQAGWRWWAVRGKVALDLTVMAPPASAPMVPKLGFSILDL